MHAYGLGGPGLRFGAEGLDNPRPNQRGKGLFGRKRQEITLLILHTGNIGFGGKKGPIRLADICLWTKAWRSGAAWVAQSTAQGIAEAGGRITFIAPLAEPILREPNHANLTRVLLRRELAAGQGSKLQKLRASLARIFGSVTAVLKERQTTKTFLVTIPDPLVFTLPLFAVLRMSGAQILLIVHDAVPHVWRLGPRWRAIERWSYGLSYRLATTLVALTPTVKEALVRDFGFDPSKVRVIPHGAFTLDNVPALPGYGRILQFGTIRRNKCVLEVIRAMTIVRRTDPELKLVIAGEPHAWDLGYWDECRAAIAEDPEGFEVRAEYVSDDDLPALVAGVDAFVLAYEDFASQSGVGIIAGANARPVIATQSGGLADLLASGLCGETIAGPVTTESVAVAIATFRATTASEWRERSARGAHALREALSWQSIGKAYLEAAR